MNYGIQRIGFYRGRPIRDTNGHPGGGVPAGSASQTGGGNNAGGEGEGNNADSGSNDSDSNNTGDQFDPLAFWNGPAPDDVSAPPGESAGNNGGGSDTKTDSQKEFQTQLAQRLESLSFDNVFDATVAEEINNGNYENVQKRFNAMGQQIVREALAMNIQVLKPFAEQLIEQVRGETNQTFNTRDNKQALETLFPAAKNPAMAKTIQPIYDQALKNAKGDRTKAVAETKQMLRFMAGESATDLNIEVAPRGQGDRGPAVPNSKFNWLDELTSR